MYEDCTWQLRRGFVEIGSKKRLAAPAARELRTYDLTDLLLEPPSFASPLGGGQAYARLDSVYVEAVLGESNRRALRNGQPIPRKNPRQIILELVEGIVESIEPGRWDIGEKTEVEELVENDPKASDRSKRGQSPRTKLVPANSDAWASIRTFRESLIVTAPDFMHRQLGGYPTPKKPSHLLEEASPR